MAAFDPTAALIGGALIGLAAALLMILDGRIAGVSGILGGAIAPSSADRSWRLTFIAGLLLAPMLLALFGHPLPRPQMPTSWMQTVAAGLLVGYGARLAGGCTSGHGVCGVARLSSRSIVATAVFIGAGAAVVALVRHRLGV